MKFFATDIEGAWLIGLQPQADERGYFMRTWSADEMSALGLATRFAQCSVSANRRRGTLRGMHYQLAPHAEAKLVSCFRGRIFDAIVDLRRESPSFLKTYTVELALEERNALYIPAGVAHGFLTLDDDSLVHYQIDAGYAPAAARGMRWNDPLLDVEWPMQPLLVSDRDRAFPDFQP